MSVYVGVNNVARKVSKIYVGDSNNKAKEITKAYVGVNNIARQTFTSYVPPVEGNVTVSFNLSLTNDSYVQGRVGINVPSTSTGNILSPSFSKGASITSVSLSVNSSSNSKAIISYSSTRVSVQSHSTAYFAIIANKAKLTMGISDLNLNGTTRPFTAVLKVISSMYISVGSTTQDQLSQTIQITINFDGTNVTYNTSGATGTAMRDLTYRYTNNGAYQTYIYHPTVNWSISSSFTLTWL